MSDYIKVTEVKWFDQQTLSIFTTCIPSVSSVLFTFCHRFLDRYFWTLPLASLLLRSTAGSKLTLQWRSLLEYEKMAAESENFKSYVFWGSNEPLGKRWCPEFNYTFRTASVLLIKVSYLGVLIKGVAVLHTNFRELKVASTQPASTTQTPLVAWHNMCC